MKLEDQRTTVYKVDPNHPETADLPTLRTEELLLNMGPQHPSTHGVLKVILELEGERLVKSTPVLGFLHRGVEKLAEGGTYHQFIPHTDRLDYVCAMYNNFAYCRAVEKLMDITIPERGEYLRTIVAEIQRIIGHLFWLGTPFCQFFNPDSSNRRTAPEHGPSTPQYAWGVESHFGTGRRTPREIHAGFRFSASRG